MLTTINQGRSTRKPHNTKTIKMDIRTDHEKKNAERRQKTAALYREYRKKFPDASDNRIFGCIAEELGMTTPGVRTICIEMGVATKKTSEAS